MTELSGILPSELEEIFESLEYEQGGLSIDSVHYFDNELHFNFTLHLRDLDSDTIEYQLWQMQVDGYRDSKINMDDVGEFFNFYSDHFLLWEFTDEQTELLFKRATKQPEILLSEIYLIHLEKFENKLPLFKFLNGGNLLTLGKWDTGLFAKGPKRILELYFNSLKKLGKEPYYFNTHHPKKWMDGKWFPEDTDLKLALLGGTYFIGKAFSFKRLK